MDNNKLKLTPDFLEDRVSSNFLPAIFLTSLLSTLAGCNISSVPPQDLPVEQCYKERNCQIIGPTRKRVFSDVLTPEGVYKVYQHNHNFAQAFGELHVTGAYCPKDCNAEVAITLREIVKEHNKSLAPYCINIINPDRLQQPTDEEIKKAAIRVQKGQRTRDFTNPTIEYPFYDFDCRKRSLVWEIPQFKKSRTSKTNLYSDGYNDALSLLYYKHIKAKNIY